MNERFKKRDGQIKDFARRVQGGIETSPELDKDFMQGTDQISSRKALRMHAGGDSLDDTVAEVRLSFFQAIVRGQYKPDDNSAASYVSRITSNQIINDRKKANSARNWQKKQPKQNNGHHSPERQVVQRELIEETERDLTTLCEEQQQVVIYTANGYSIGETANAMGETNREVSKKLYRARKNLKALRKRRG